MRVVVITSSVMAAFVVLTGFVSHTTGDDFNSSRVVPLAVAAIAGGLTGGTFSLITKPVHLSRFFAFITMTATVFKGFNASLSKIIIKTR
jgi:uncharacterized membrane protein YfcA